MKIKDFLLERYFARYEFKARYLFSSSDCDGYAMSEILELASESERQLWANLKLGYTESAGHPLLRKAIAGLYDTIDPDKTLVLSPGEANYSLMRTLLNAGDEVVCMAPAYQSLYEVARSIGCKLKFWLPSEKTWHYDPEELEHLVTEKTRLIIINFPHNPTGAYPTLTEFEKIIEIARKYDVYLFSDEMYRLLNHSVSYEIPSACDVYKKAICLWGTAKTFGLAGLRIGWLVSHDQELLHKIRRYKDYLSICSSAPSEVLTLIAIRHKEKFVEPNLVKIRKNIKLFQTFVDKHSDTFEFIPPKAGSTGFVRLIGFESATSFCQHILETKETMIVPSTMFDYGDHHIRVGYGRENFKEILHVLED